MTEKKDEAHVFDTWLKDNIIYTKVKQASVIDLDDAIRNSRMVLEISAGTLYPILVDLRGISSITKEARDHFSMQGRNAQVSAVAMLVKSPVSNIIGNFFLGINKPSVPTHLFVSEAKAMKWLKQFHP